MTQINRINRFFANHAQRPKGRGTHRIGGRVYEWMGIRVDEKCMCKTLM
nr:hypothetical protein [uncultured Prevotella sp.]